MQSNILHRLLLLITLFFTFFSLLRTFSDVRTYGDIDLRDKIVGARLLDAGLSPYYFKWKDGEDDRLLDPLDGYDIKVSRVAVPPSLLLLFVPLSRLDHGAVQWIWFVFSYLCLFIILFQFQDLSPPGRKLLVWIAGLLFFLCAMAWQMHAERGQVYIFYTALLSSSYWFCRKERSIMAGILFAVLCWFRFPFIICLPLLLFLPDRKRIFTGIALSAVLLLVVSVLFTTSANWTDYLSSMQEWSRFEIQEMTVIRDAVPHNTPAVIEGQTNLGSMRDFWQNNRAVQKILFDLIHVRLYSIQLAAMFLLISGGLALFIFRKKKKGLRIDKEVTFIFLFLLYILTEYFSPAPSYSYHYIQWIFPVLLCISAGWVSLSFSSMLILLGLSMNLGAMSFVPYNLAIGEVILFAGVVMTVIVNRE